jgi:transposase
LYAVSSSKTRIIQGTEKGIAFVYETYTHDKEEYRRAYAVKQKMEGVPYRTIAKDIGVNYSNVFDWINNYRKDGLNGIRNKRKNGGRKPVISTQRRIRS